MIQGAWMLGLYITEKENFVVNSPMYLEHKKSAELTYKSAVQEARDKHLGNLWICWKMNGKKKKYG